MTKLKIGQINMGRRRVVAAELRTRVSQYDLIVVQEPWCYKNQVAGFGVSVRIVAQSSGERRPRAAIVVLNPTLDVMELRQHTSADQAACWIKWNNTTFVLVSSYMPPKCNIENNVAMIEAVTQRYRNVVVCADTNSWSTTWGSNTTDRRGAMLEDTMAGCQLVIINEPTGPTFVGPMGRSWIDVTLASGAMSRRISGWDLRFDTSSDHGTISFRVEAERGENECDQGRGFVTQSADWLKFKGALEGILVDKDWEEIPADGDAPSIEQRIEVLTGSIIEAAETSLRKRKKRIRPVPWWTPALTSMKKSITKLGGGTKTVLEWKKERCSELKAGASSKHTAEKCADRKRHLGTRSSKKKWKRTHGESRTE